MTVAEAYQRSVAYLAPAAPDAGDAKVKARLLVDHLAGTRYAHLMGPARQLITTTAELDALLAQIKQGRPLPYLLREWEFFGLKFICDERALIPRPETETLVEAAIRRLEAVAEPRIADLGTGTGCIAVSIAHALPQAQVWATDVEAGALELARANAERHGASERVHFVKGELGNWTAPLLAAGCARAFDAVLSNPPYIAAGAIESLQPEVRDWEPRRALDGGADGLDCYHQLAAQCGAILAPGGFLMVELGAGQFDGVRRIFQDEGWTVEEPIHDLAGIPRVLVAS